MAELQLYLKNTAALQKIILRGVADIMNDILQKLAVKLPSSVGQAAAALILESDTYNELIDGQLRHEMGVIAAKPILDAVVTNIRSGVRSTIKRAKVAGNQVSGSVLIELIKADYSEVLTVAGASFESEGGFDIPWLQWLTLEGDRILALEHRFTASPEFDVRSRTGRGIMIEPGSWKVPAEHAGQADDNWITRALVSLPLLMEKLVIAEL